MRYYWNLYAISVNGVKVAEYAGSGKWDSVNFILWRDGKVPAGRMITPAGTQIIESGSGILELLLLDGTRYRSEWIGKHESA